ncbi:TIGR03643 family protein [Marinomonas piezotolerans]|uniref:TIGR03643 family protein n=1 Tax=Marinomonas piezotolerans TaxID=2213058 RepID=A0A370U624_9GAMM|nr:TIGR03643 family protein [Marinomonas piezotolerans]RDL43221.1 TIGR03643 family protein [Marinomonas piezotolerans]
MTPYSNSDEHQSRIIEMAWEDRTPFEAIEQEYGLAEKDVIKLMRSHLKSGSFRTWRARVSGRATKHQRLRSTDVSRGYAPAQYKPCHGAKPRSR